LVVALLSPLDYVGDEYLFSVHMVQHLLLATVWPPLLLLSLPDEVIRPFVDREPVRVALRSLAFPAAAFLIFNLDITMWHIPAAYDATLQNSWIHILEHLTFMATGILAWWPVLSPVKSQRLSYPGQLLYLFAMLFPTMGLGIFFSFFQHPLYSPYVAAPRLWGMSAVTDQQLGGLVMWMPGNAPYALAMAVILIRWFDHGDPTEDWRSVPVSSQGVRG
jgi:putative membrane protein